MENGTRAFVSFVEAYGKHDCQIVCCLRLLDLAGIAHSFGILRIPQMRELNYGKHDFKRFKNIDIKTSTIAFKDLKMEKARQDKIKIKKQVNKNKPNEIEKENFEDEDEELSRKRKKRSKLSEWEELQQEDRFLKKFKAGKITKEQLNKLL